MQRIECELNNKEYALTQMRKRLEMEKQLLERLDSGLLDGVIGSGFNMGTLTSRALIENGKPMLVKYLSILNLSIPVPQSFILKNFLFCDCPNVI